LITVLRAGPLTTVQDRGRPGFAHLGVPRSGALDQPALRLANELVGNDPSAAGLETTLMGCRLRFDTPATIAVTGASCTVKIDGVVVDGQVIDSTVSGARAGGGSAGGGLGAGGSSSSEPSTSTTSAAPGAVDVPAGVVVEIGRATAGVRSYLAVAGGIEVEPVLGSRSTDTLSGLGPPRLTDGQVLAIGPRPSGRVTGSSREQPERGEIVLGVWVGPRDDWVEVAGLFVDAYAVSPMSNRVACRLAGTALHRTRAGELPPEGLVLGAIQVPPDGQPLIFLADHPTTGGYPVIGVVDDVTALAQARPGTSVRFRELD
jgi:allophanate hydrolase subunit 2